MGSSLSQIGSQQFYASLTAALNQAFAGIYDTSITLIQYPAQGDFLWNYQNINQVFNQGTFDYLSANVSPGLVSGTVQLSTSGGFPNAYAQLINKIAYVLGSSDQAKLQAALGQAATKTKTLLDDYQSAFGTITPAEMASAQQSCGAVVQTPQDYVIGYVLGYVWSGRQAAQLPPLTYAQMAAASDLAQLLPQAPTTGGPVLADVNAYLKTVASIATLQSEVQMGSWLITQLISNTAAPNVDNGGMKTVNPNTGLVSAIEQVRYGVGRTLADIECELTDEGRTVTIDVAVPAAAAGVSLVDILTPAVSLSLTSQRADKTTAGQTQDVAGQVQSVTIEYQGYSLVPVSPACWQQPTGGGWYCATPIAEAYANGNNDITGFKFVAPSGYNLQPLEAGGDFGLLTNLLISNYPKVTFNYSGADSTSLQTALQASADDNFMLADAAGATSPSPVSYSAASQPGPASDQLSVTFTPQVATVSPMQQTAYVIGGAFTNPAVQAQLPPIINGLLTQQPQGT